MYRKKTIPVYFFSIPGQQTVFISTKRYILQQHKVVISKLYNSKIRIRRLKFRKKAFTAEFDAFIQQLTQFGIKIIDVTDSQISPFVLLNIKQNGIYSKQSAILNHVLSKINVKVKSIIPLRDSESVLINKNIKLTFIRVPYYNFYTFKISAPYQYLNRLYS